MDKWLLRVSYSFLLWMALTIMDILPLSHHCGWVGKGLVHNSLYQKETNLRSFMLTWCKAKDPGLCYDQIRLILHVKGREGGLWQTDCINDTNYLSPCTYALYYVTLLCDPHHSDFGLSYVICSSWCNVSNVMQSAAWKVNFLLAIFYSWNFLLPRITCWRMK